MRVGLALILIAAVGALTGCSSGEQGPPITASVPKSSAGNGAIPSNDQITPPGTSLRLGQTALVNYAPSGDPAMAALTVSSVEKGSVSDLAGWDLKPDEVGKTPYYISLEVVGAKGSAGLVGKHIDGVVPLTDVDYPSTLLRLTGKGLPRCESQPFPDHFTEGTTVKSCLIYLVAASVKVKGAAFPLASALNGSVPPITWQ